MIDEYKINKSIFLNCQDEMKSICRYLSDYFGIEHFSYIKIFNDDTLMCLTTHCEWSSNFYLKINFQKSDVFYKTMDAYTSGVVLWSSLENQTSFIGFKEYSKLSHGISLIEKHEYDCEIFNFCAYQDNFQIINFYINNLDILWRHVFYFKDKAEDLIKKANEEKWILPKCTKPSKNDMLITDYNKNKTILSSTVPTKHYHLSIHGVKTYLTASEARCCYFLIQNQNIKEIAKTTELSPRTVETYLNTAKQKLHCFTKSELVKKLLNHSILSRIYL